MTAVTAPTRSRTLMFLSLAIALAFLAGMAPSGSSSSALEQGGCAVSTIDIPAKAGTYPVGPTPAPGQTVEVCGGLIRLRTTINVGFLWIPHTWKGTAGTVAIPAPSAGASGVRLTISTSVNSSVTGWISTRIIGQAEPPPPPPPPAVDCKVSDFVVVADWSRLDGSSIETRTLRRTVVVPASNGGAACPPLEQIETRPYVPPPPPPPPIVITGESPIGRNEHPRFWITRDTRPGLRARWAEGGALHGDAQWLVGLVDGFLDTPWTSPFYFLRTVAEVGAMLEDGPIAGVPARRTSAEYFAWVTKTLRDYMVATGSSTGEESLAGIVSADLAWNRLSADDRAAFAKWCQGADAKMDDGSPWVTQHIHVRAAKISCGLTLLNAGVADAWAMARVQLWRTQWRDLAGVMGSEAALGDGLEAGNGQGQSYAFGHHLITELMLEEAYRTAYNIPESVHYGSAETNQLRLQAKFLAYRMVAVPGYLNDHDRNPATPPLPCDGWAIDKGHYNTASGVQHCDGAVGYSFGSTLISGYLESIARAYREASPDDAALTEWLIDRHFGRTVQHQNNVLYNHFDFFRMIRGSGLSERLAPKSPTELALPLTRVLETKGLVTFKDCWCPTDVVVTFQANKYPLNNFMAYTWPGTFQVYRKGPQIINAGGDGSGHAQSFIPGAQVAFPDVEFDPARLPTHSNTGGWRGTHARLGAASWSTELLERDALVVRSGDSYEYIFADLTRAYENTRTPGVVSPRIESYTRQFVYLRPRTGGPLLFVIVDRARRVSSSTELRWFAHFGGRPTVTADGGLRVDLDEFGYAGTTYVTPITPATAPRITVGNWTPYAKYADIASTGEVRPWVPVFAASFAPAPVERTLSDVLITVVEVANLGAAKSPIVYHGGETLSVGGRTLTFSATEVTIK